MSDALPEQQGFRKQINHHKYKVNEVALGERVQRAISFGLSARIENPFSLKEGGKTKTEHRPSRVIHGGVATLPPPPPQSVRPFAI